MKIFLSSKIRDISEKLSKTKSDFIPQQIKTNKDDILIFGYGSLLSEKGINGRGLKHQYKKEDLTPATLIGYRREWNAKDHKDGYTYLGLVKDKESKVNGILFPLHADDHDIKSFEKSESDGVLYDLVDVTEDVIPKKRGYKIYTDVTRDPKYGGDIDPKYLDLVNKGLSKRGADFNKEFLGTTFVKPKKT